MSPRLSKKLLAVLIIVPLIISVGIVSLVVVINLPRQIQDDSIESKIRNFMTNTQIPFTHLPFLSVNCSKNLAFFHFFLKKTWLKGK